MTVCTSTQVETFLKGDEVRTATDGGWQLKFPFTALFRGTMSVNKTCFYVTQGSNHVYVHRHVYMYMYTYMDL